MGNTEFRDAALALQRNRDGPPGRRRAICTRGRSSCSSTAPSARRSRTGSTRRSSSRAKCRARASSNGESLKVPLTREQIDDTTGPYPTNMRRNVTQGVPGLGIWYMTGRTERNPNAWNETHIGLFSLIGAQRRSRAQGAAGLRRDRAQARDAEPVPERDPDAGQLVSVRVLDGQRLRPRRRRHEPRGQARGHGEAARGAARERRRSATATTARRRSSRTTSPISTRSTTSRCAASTRR